MKKLPISVCLISGAEAHRIGQALASVAEWTAEIVVVLNEEVDDGTEHIAAEFEARIFRERWGGFVKQKNSVTTKATQPWVLGLDADEQVPPALRDEIFRLFQDEARLAQYAAFNFPRCTFYCGRWIRHGDWYPDRVTRLWRRVAGVWEGVDPHAALKVNGAVGRLRSDLSHYSNESIDRQIAKIGPYSSDFVRHYLRQPGVPGLFELVARPGWRFVRAYFLRLGFLDGWQGYYIAWLTAFSALTRYVKVRESQLVK